jgi:SHS family lactate transporter-like MFS transporter
VLWVQKNVKEPEVWVENRRKQREEQRETRAPLLDIFRLRVLGNTISACLWMASGFIIYYTVFGLFATHLQKDLHLGAEAVALPLALTNVLTFVASGFWGWVSDHLGRRWGMIIPAAIGILITPWYLFTTSYAIIVAAFALQGAFLGAIYGQNPSYLSERFPTEVRATAAGFCYHQGAIWAGFAGPVLTAWAASQASGFAVPMLVTTVVACLVFIVSLLFGPETKGVTLVSDLAVQSET